MLLPSWKLIFCHSKTLFLLSSSLVWREREIRLGLFFIVYVKLRYAVKIIQKKMDHHYTDSCIACQFTLLLLCELWQIFSSILTLSRNIIIKKWSGWLFHPQYKIIFDDVNCNIYIFVVIHENVVNSARFCYTYQATVVLMHCESTYFEEPSRMFFWPKYTPGLKFRNIIVVKYQLT